MSELGGAHLQEGNLEALIWEGQVKEHNISKGMGTHQLLGLEKKHWPVRSGLLEASFASL